MADNAVSKAKQGIADDQPETPRVYLRIMKSQPVRLDSNLRPSVPKALNSSGAALVFQAIVNFLLDFV